MFLNTLLWQPYTSLLFWCRKGKRTTCQMASAYSLLLHDKAFSACDSRMWM